jgi:ankyrin repeat protein
MNSEDAKARRFRNGSLRPAPAFLPSRFVRSRILHFPDNSRAASRQPVAMKNPFLLFSLTVSVVVALAADPLTEAFQRGLLAEEAQRDLKAAAAAYGEVLRQADAQRELVATALFRLAETQRRLGQTNEALAGYRRLVREFSEQTNLTSLAAARLPEKPAGGAGVQLLEAQWEQASQSLARMSRDQTELAGFLRQTRALASLGEISGALAARYPSVELQRLRAERNSAEVAAAGLSPDFGPQHPEVVRNKAVLAKLDEQLEREITSIMGGLEVREQALGAEVESQRRVVRLLEAKLAQERNDSGVTPAAGAGRSEAIQLLAEEIRLAEAQVAEIRLQGSQGAATQAELLQAQRDVLALKRQLAGLRQPELVELLPAPATAAVPEPDEESREIERLRRMLANSPDLINAPKGDPLETPLQTAARLDQARVVEFLLAQKADLNVPAGGRTPLHLAAKAGHKRMVELLLKAGAKVDAQANDGQTPLHMAIAAGHRQVVQALLAAGANLTLQTQLGTPILTDKGQVAHATPLGLAVACRSVALIEQLVAAGAKLDEPAGATSPQMAPMSPLLLACSFRDFGTAGRLLDLGAKPGAEGKGQSSMSLVIGLSAPVSFLEKLANKGAQLVWTGSRGETLLHLAAQSDHDEAVSWLLKHGLSPDAQNAEGDSVLLAAVSRAVQQQGRAWSPGQKPSAALAIVGLLLDAKANPNLTNGRGYSPLCFAVDSGQLETVKRLLQAGGNPNQPHPTLGPLLNAAIAGARPAPGVFVPRSVPGVGGAGGGTEQSGSKREVAEALLAAGADPNADRILVHAINLGPEWVQLFLAYRADPNRRPIGGGDTPLEAIQRYRTHGRPAELTLESLAESERLLRAAGARDDVPDFSAIKVARKSANYVQAVFRSGATNDPNRFTLLELLATHCGEMTAPLAFRGVDVAADGGDLGGVGIAPAPRLVPVRHGFASRESGLGFTDWRRVVIYRAAKQGLERQELPVDVEALVAVGDCSRDVALEWGDVVELPERDHPVGAAFEGAPAGMEKLWQSCLARTVTITIKGEAKPLKLAVGAETSGSTPGVNPFSLMGALSQPGLLRTSSDLRQVRVERPAAPQPLRWQLDCSDSMDAATFWLRDGDVIVVPDLPAGGK